MPTGRSESRPLVGKADLPAVLIGDVGDLSYRQPILAQLLSRVDVQNAVLGLACSLAEQERDTSQIVGLKVLGREESDTVERDCGWEYSAESISKKKSAFQALSASRTRPVSKQPAQRLAQVA